MITAGIKDVSKRKGWGGVKGNCERIIFNWFIPVVCEYNVKYLRDIRRVRQNTALYYDVMCHRTDNMFRPFTIRPSSGLTSRAKEEIVKL